MEAISTINLIQELTNVNMRRQKLYKNRENPFMLDDVLFKTKYRFSKETVHFIVSLVESDLNKDKRGGGISPQLQVLTALRCWGRGEVQDDAGDLHGLSQPTVSRICVKVAHSIARHANHFIKMPSNIREEEKVMQEFKNIANFPGVNGAIDCTHIKIKKTGGSSAQYYINRKGFYSLNVQVICDANLLIQDVIVRWRGSTHDSRIFNESVIKERFDGREFRGHLIGDSGYPLLPYLFTPLLRPTDEREERYNRAHIRTRNTVERCFGVWKQRFRCLLNGMTVSLPNAKIVIVALAVLHNIALIRQDIIEDEINISQERPVLTHRNTENESASAVRRQARYILNNFIANNF